MFVQSHLRGSRHQVGSNASLCGSIGTQAANSTNYLGHQNRGARSHHRQVSSAQQHVDCVGHCSRAKNKDASDNPNSAREGELSSRICTVNAHRGAPQDWNGPLCPRLNDGTKKHIREASSRGTENFCEEELIAIWFEVGVQRGESEPFTGRTQECRHSHVQILPVGELAAHHRNKHSDLKGASGRFPGQVQGSVAGSHSPLNHTIVSQPPASTDGAPPAGPILTAEDEPRIEGSAKQATQSVTRTRQRNQSFAAGRGIAPISSFWLGHSIHLNRLLLDTIRSLRIIIAARCLTLLRFVQACRLYRELCLLLLFCCDFVAYQQETWRLMLLGCQVLVAVYGGHRKSIERPPVGNHNEGDTIRVSSNDRLSMERFLAGTDKRSSALICSRESYSSFDAYRNQEHGARYRNLCSLGQRQLESCKCRCEACRKPSSIALVGSVEPSKNPASEERRHIASQHGRAYYSNGAKHISRHDCRDGRGSAPSHAGLRFASPPGYHARAPSGEPGSSIESQSSGQHFKHRCCHQEQHCHLERSEPVQVASKAFGSFESDRSQQRDITMAGALASESRQSSADKSSVCRGPWHLRHTMDDDDESIGDSSQRWLPARQAGAHSRAPAGGAPIQQAREERATQLACGSSRETSASSPTLTEHSVSQSCRRANKTATASAAGTTVIAPEPRQPQRPGRFAREVEWQIGGEYPHESAFLAAAGPTSTQHLRAGGRHEQMKPPFRAGARDALSYSFDHADTTYKSALISGDIKAQQSPHLGPSPNPVSSAIPEVQAHASRLVSQANSGPRGKFVKQASVHTQASSASNRSVAVAPSSHEMVAPTNLAYKEHDQQHQARKLRVVADLESVATSSETQTTTTNQVTGYKKNSHHSGLPSLAKVSLAGAKRRLGFRRRGGGLSSLSVHRSEEVFTPEALAAGSWARFSATIMGPAAGHSAGALANTSWSQLSDSSWDLDQLDSRSIGGAGGGSGGSGGRLSATGDNACLWLGAYRSAQRHHHRHHNHNHHQLNPMGQNNCDPRAGFIEGLGAGQIASRQALVSPYLGDIQLGLSDRRGMLEVEVIRLRQLQPKACSKRLPSPYVKVYLMRGKKCLAKFKTNQARQTLDPLYQQRFIFRDDYSNCLLQVIVWGDYGKHDRKSLMGAAQIFINDLDISNLVIGWYKLFNAPSMASSYSSKVLRQTLSSTRLSSEQVNLSTSCKDETNDCHHNAQSSSSLSSQRP